MEHQEPQWVLTFVPQEPTEKLAHFSVPSVLTITSSKRCFLEISVTPLLNMLTPHLKMSKSAFARVLPQNFQNHFFEIMIDTKGFLSLPTFWVSFKGEFSYIYYILLFLSGP